MARRQLLTDEERQALLGIPPDADSLARLFTLSRLDRNLVAERRSDANRLGCAVQLALLRHPGTALAYLDQPADTLVTWMAGQLDVPAAVFAEYACRPQTMTDHARQLAATLGLRTPTMADLPSVIEVAAEAARATDRGQPIAAAVIAALRTAGIILPGAAVIERVAIAGRARARKRAADALVAGLSAEHLTKLDGLLVIDPSVGMTPFAWLKAMPIAPKADHVSELLDRLCMIRGICVPVENAARIHEDRLQQFVREGHASDAHQLGRYAEHRRRAILVATVLDLETRVTDAILDMADKLIGGLFAKARNAARRRYAASASNVGRLMRMFHGTIEALAAAHEGEADAFEAVDDAVGWPKLLRVREEVQELASLAGEDPLVRAADRWRTLRKFAPALIEALQFRSTRAGDPMLGALKLLAGLNQSGKREVPADAPMPFRKEWRERAALDRRGTSWITLGRCAGALAGVGILALLSATTLRLFVGVATLLTAAGSLLSGGFVLQPPAFLVAGLVTGVTETATGIGGPPMALLYQHQSAPVLRSTLATCFLVGEIVSLLLLLGVGRLLREQVVTAALLLPVLAVGAWASRWLRGRFTGARLRVAVLVFAVLSGLICLV